MQSLCNDILRCILQYCAHKAKLRLTCRKSYDIPINHLSLAIDRLGVDGLRNTLIKHDRISRLTIRVDLWHTNSTTCAILVRSVAANASHMLVAVYLPPHIDYDVSIQWHTYMCTGLQRLNVGANSHCHFQRENLRCLNLQYFETGCDVRCHGLIPLLPLLRMKTLILGPYTILTETIPMPMQNFTIDDLHIGNFCLLNPVFWQLCSGIRKMHIGLHVNLRRCLHYNSVRKLQNLSLAGANGLGSDDWQCVMNVAPSLMELHIGRACSRSNLTHVLNACTNLQLLTLADYNEDLLSALSKMHQTLQTLRLGVSCARLGAIAYHVSLTRVQCLHLDYTTCNLLWRLLPRTGQKLQSLIIGPNNHIGGRHGGLRAICEHCTCLQRLVISGDNALTDSDCQKLMSAPFTVTLRILCISRSLQHITPFGYDVLHAGFRNFCCQLYDPSAATGL